MSGSRSPGASSLFDLSGRVAVVTGGGAGIGRALALTLAEGGADVVVADIDDVGARSTAAEIVELGRRSRAVRCDVSDRAEVDAVIEQVEAEFGRLDIAVNNAGIYRPGVDSDLSVEDWRQVIDVNLTGVWLCATAEMRLMRKQKNPGGKIINIASLGATRAISNGAYDAAKAGVVHLSATLARQWGTYNINVNALSPGYVGEVFGRARPLDQQARLREVTPLGHVMRLKDLAGPLLFLASAASDYLTGQNLLVDGGHSLSTWLSPLPDRVVPPRVSPDREFDGL